MARPDPSDAPLLAGTLSPRPEQGFTLVEVLITLVLLSMVAAVSFGSLRQVLEARERLRPYLDRSQDTTLAAGWFRQTVQALLADYDNGKHRFAGSASEISGLTASPLLASGLAAASALVLGGSDEQKSEWLPKIADGSAVGALAIDEGPHHNPEKVETKFEGGKITGRKTFVLEGMAANVLIVSARNGSGGSDGIGLYLVKADDAGVKRQRSTPKITTSAAPPRVNQTRDRSPSRPVSRTIANAGSSRTSPAAGWTISIRGSSRRHGTSAVGASTARGVVGDGVVRAPGRVCEPALGRLTWHHPASPGWSR